MGERANGPITLATTAAALLAPYLRHVADRALDNLCDSLSEATVAKLGQLYQWLRGKVAGKPDRAGAEPPGAGARERQVSRGPPPSLSPRSPARPASARPRSPPRTPNGCTSASPMVSSTSTCAAGKTSGRIPGSCSASSSSAWAWPDRPSRKTSSTAPPGFGPSSPATGSSSCSTTRSTRHRSGHCCRAVPAPPRSSPTGRSSPDCRECIPSTWTSSSSIRASSSWPESPGGSVDAEPQEAETIVRLCGYPPLAVRIAGAKLAARRHWTLKLLANRLANDHNLLHDLKLRDLEVRASFELSHRDLEEKERRAFRLLPLLKAPDFTAWVASALLNCELVDAHVVLAEYAAGLLEPGSARR